MTKLTSDSPTSDSAIRSRVIEFAKSKFGDKRGWKVKFQKSLGIETIQQLSNVLNGRDSISTKFLQKMVDSLGADMSYLKAGITKNYYDNFSSSKDETMQIPLYQYKKGKMMVIQEDTAEYITVRRSADKTLYAIIAKGDSMEGTFDEGSTVIASEIREIETDKTIPVIIQLETGETLIRFCKVQKNDTYLLSTSNKKFEPVIIHKSQIQSIHRITESLKRW